MSSSHWRRGVRRYLRRRPFSVYYHEEYRWLLGGAQATSRVDARAPERLLRYLLYEGLASQSTVRTPRRIGNHELAQRYSQGWLDGLGRWPSGTRRDAALAAHWRACRLVTGATLAAAHSALAEGRPSVNLAGGFLPGSLAGRKKSLLIDDVGVAIAALRASGFRGHIAIVLRSRQEESLAAKWGEKALPLSVVELTEPRGTHGLPATQTSKNSDEKDAIQGLRIDEVALAFVIGQVSEAPWDDVHALDGWLEAVRRRDGPLARQLQGLPSVWLPGGLFPKGAWRAFAGTLHALAGEAAVVVPEDHPSWWGRFTAMAAEIPSEALRGEEDVSWADVSVDLGLTEVKQDRFLGYYTPQGIEFALRRYGVLRALERLGYQEFRVEIGSEPQGDRVRLFAMVGASPECLAECLASRELIEGRPVLYLHWLTLRDASAKSEDSSLFLPGQDVPGLGIMEELAQAVVEAARRLALDGVALVPAWYHTAFIARRHARFLERERQARFEALMELLSTMPLAAQSQAVHSGRICLDGVRYEWEAAPMVGWLADVHKSSAQVAEPGTYRGRFSLKGS